MHYAQSVLLRAHLASASDLGDVQGLLLGSAAKKSLHPGLHVKGARDVGALLYLQNPI